MDNTSCMADASTDDVVEHCIGELHPTQLAVGMYQVAYKKGRMREKMKEGKLEKYLRKHPVPVVRGPGGVPYMLDHHHLCAALVKLGVDKVCCTVKHDWSGVPEGAFWERMREGGYLWLGDQGSPVNLQKLVQLLPRTTTGLRDDPYRSLAAWVKYAGGFRKTWEPFAEFHWADYFRTQLPAASLAEPDNPQVWVRRSAK